MRIFLWCAAAYCGCFALWIALCTLGEWLRDRENRKREQNFRRLLIRLETHDVDRESAIAARKAREAQDDAMRLRGLGVTAGYGERA